MKPVTRADEVQTLLAVQQALTSRLDLAAVLQMIADQARRLTSSDMSAVYLLKQDHLEIAVLSGEVASQVCGLHLPMNGSLAGRAIQSGQSFLVSDVDHEHGVYAHLVDAVHARSFVVVPLFSANGPLGTITVANKTPHSLGVNDRRLLTMLAPGAVIALENARLYEQAQQAAALEERQHLARELHDAVTQTLFSASLIADVLPRIWDRSPLEGQQRLDELRQLTRGALAEMRNLLVELRPSALMEVEFADLVRQLCDAFAARTCIPVQVQVEGQRSLPPDVQVVLYRIMQEALNNTNKHARAKQVQVRLSLGLEGLKLIIQDDGVGFQSLDAKPEQFGLNIMHERAASVGASLQITSRPEQGTHVIVIWSDQTQQEIQHDQ